MPVCPLTHQLLWSLSMQLVLRNFHCVVLGSDKLWCLPWDSFPNFLPECHVGVDLCSVCRPCPAPAMAFWSSRGENIMTVAVRRRWQFWFCLTELSCQFDHPLSSGPQHSYTSMIRMSRHTLPGNQSFSLFLFYISLKHPRFLHAYQKNELRKTYLQACRFETRFFVGAVCHSLSQSHDMWSRTIVIECPIRSHPTFSYILTLCRLSQT